MGRIGPTARLPDRGARSSRRSPGRRRLVAACALAGAFLLFAAGCFPKDDKALLWGRRPGGQAGLSSLSKGQTTREEVLLQFGAPAASFREGRLLAYDWGSWAGVLPVPAFPGFAPIPRHHSLLLEFDGDGRLAGVETHAEVMDQPSLRLLEERAAAPGTRTGEWVVVMDPMAEVWGRLAAPPTEPRARVSVGGFRDARPAPYRGTLLFGRRLNFPFSGKLVVHTRHPAGELLRAVVARQLEYSGFLVVEGDADLVLSGEVQHFQVEGSTVEVVLRLEARTAADGAGIVRRYRTLATFSDSNGTQRVSLENKTRLALEDLQADVASDRRLVEFLSRPPARAGTPSRTGE